MLKILIKLLLLIWFVFKLLLPVQLLHHALASSLKGNTFLTNHKMASLLNYLHRSRYLGELVHIHDGNKQRHPHAHLRQRRHLRVSSLPKASVKVALFISIIMSPRESPAATILLILQAQVKLGVVISPMNGFLSPFISTSTLEATHTKELCLAGPAQRFNISAVRRRVAAPRGSRSTCTTLFISEATRYCCV